MFFAKVEQFKIFWIIVFGLIITLFISAGIHKFYVSTTRIEYVEKSQSVQIISRIFIDDIEEVLRKRYDESIVLGPENKSNSGLLRSYLLQKLKITIGGVPAPLEYIGEKYEIDIVKVYLEVKNIRNFNNVEIENTMLFELFNEQKNIIHLNSGHGNRSLVLTKENPNGMLNFD